jgi:hypothetical protein
VIQPLPHSGSFLKGRGLCDLRGVEKEGNPSELVAGLTKFWVIVAGENNTFGRCEFGGRLVYCVQIVSLVRP